MKEEEIKNIIKNEQLNLSEMRSILDVIVKKVVKELNIEDDPIKCQESSKKVGEICFGYDLQYIPFNTLALNMNELEHHFGFITFPNQKISFLIDLTFEQFIRDDYYITFNGKQKNIPNAKKLLPFSTKNNLLNDKYLLLTEENFVNYFSCLIKMYKKVNNVNINDMLQKSFEMLYNVYFYDANLVKSEDIESKKR